jgi:hypothetical protein
MSVKVAVFRSARLAYVLLLSIISLFVGPILYLWLRRGGFVAKAFDSLIIVALVILMAFLLIPESWAQLGYWSVALILAGYLLPGVLEHLIKRAAHTFHLVSLLLALAGLALHAMLDGAALTMGHGSTGSNLSLAIVLHRFGVGIMLWMMVQPVFGKRAAFSVLGFVALATVGGYLLSEIVLGMEGDYAMSVIQALIIGMIVHSLVHSSHGASHVR